MQFKRNSPSCIRALRRYLGYGGPAADADAAEADILPMRHSLKSLLPLFTDDGVRVKALSICRTTASATTTAHTHSLFPYSPVIIVIIIIIIIIRQLEVTGMEAASRMSS
jgi:hypothetical protein